MKKYKVLIFGCGVMGRKTAQALLDKASFEIVGAVDIDPELFGKDLGEILDSPRTLGILIEKKPEDLLSSVEADAAVLATTSCLENVAPQVIQCIEAGLNVISTCEELSFPWKRYPELTQNLDRLAREHGVTVIGTGINPGFLMDMLPLVLTAPCLNVRSVKVTRMINSAKRRVPFQAKVGTGMTQDEFREKIENKIITGHVGLLESVNMIAAGLGWELDDAVELPPEPVIDEKEINTVLGAVKPGSVIGLRSVAYGKKDDKDVISLEFCANAAVEEEYDEIFIEGDPSLHQRIIGGVHGDIGTVAVTINTIPRTVEAPPGVIVMKDLPPPKAVL